MLTGPELTNFIKRSVELVSWRLPAKPAYAHKRHFLSLQMVKDLPFLAFEDLSFDKTPVIIFD
jgi:hypothetical protein